MEDALRVASSPHDFKLLVAAEGRTSTSMDDLTGSDERPASTDAGPAPAVHQVRPAPSMAPANGRPSAPPPGMAA